MGIFDFFRSRSEDQSARVAKDRLQVLIAHERTGRNGPDYLPMLRQDILNVIKKYVSVDEDDVSVQLDSQDNCDVLELNITLPEDSEAKSSTAKGSNSRQSRSKAGRNSGNSGNLGSSGTNRKDSGKKSKSQSKVT